MFFFFQQKTAYGMRISDWSSDVCSSDLVRQDRCVDHHHRHRPQPCLWGHVGGLSPADPDRVRPLHRLCRIELLPELLQLRRWGADLMTSADDIPGFYAPVHRALAEPILLGGAPRALAIVNGPLAGAIGLRSEGHTSVLQSLMRS